MKKKFNCPAELTASILGGKWRAILLYNLTRSRKRFGELKRLSPGITQATLAIQLRELEKSGLVRKNLIGKDRLSGVEYSLTSKGESIKPVLYSMIRWGLANQKDHVDGDFRMLAFRK